MDERNEYGNDELKEFLNRFQENKRYTIGEVAKELNIHEQTLRKYEYDFKILIPRTEQGHRFYTKKEIEIFKQIVLLKDKDIPSGMIRDFLDRSVIYSEHKEEALTLVPIDKLNGAELQQLINQGMMEAFRKELDRRDQLRTEEIQKMKEEIVDTIIQEYRAQEGKRVEQGLLENSKLKEYLDEKFRGDKKGFFSKLFNK